MSARPSELTVQDRENIAAALARVIQEQVLDERNDVKYLVQRGHDFGEDELETTLVPNRTMTILVEINGGATGEVFPRPGSQILQGR